MLHVAAQILREIMQRAARRADGGGFVFQTKAVERRDLEMVAHGEEGGFRRERPVIVAADDPKCALQQCPHGRAFSREDDFRRPQAFQFSKQRGIVFEFGRKKITGGQIHEREAKGFS